MVLKHEANVPPVCLQVDARRRVNPDFPANLDAGSLGRYSPAIDRRMVVLPLPDGPKIASTSPGANREVDIERYRRRADNRRGAWTRSRPPPLTSSQPRRHEQG